MDFFTVPTATFRVLYVFFVIHHARRAVLHVHLGLGKGTPSMRVPASKPSGLKA